MITITLTVRGITTWYTPEGLFKPCAVNTTFAALYRLASRLLRGSLEKLSCIPRSVWGVRCGARSELCAVMLSFDFRFVFSSFSVISSLFRRCAKCREAVAYPPRDRCSQLANWSGAHAALLDWFIVTGLFESAVALLFLSLNNVVTL